jgi:hypothetical protein
MPQTLTAQPHWTDMTLQDETIEIPDQTAPVTERRRVWPRFGLSATQLVATALAAITATIAGSYLGVSGTVIGAALASVVGAIGNAVYAHSLHSTRARVRQAVPTRWTAAPGREPAAEEPPVLPAPVHRPRRERREQSAWRGVAVGSIAVFVAVLAAITGVEIVAGRPISDLVRGDSGSGTTIFGDAGSTGTGGGTAGTPTVTKTVTPSVVVTTPTVTQTAPAVTETATPTVTESTSTSSSPSESAGSSDTSTEPSAPPSQLG